MQIGSQCGLQYGGINVAIINFAALPFLCARTRRMADPYPVFGEPTTTRKRWLARLLRTQFSVVSLLGRVDQHSHQAIDHIVLQGVLSILQANPESKAFFIRFQTFAPIFIK